MGEGMSVHLDNLLASLRPTARMQVELDKAMANALTGVGVVRVSSEGVEHVPLEDLYVQPTDEERRIAAMSDEALLAEIAACPVDVLESDACDLLYGEAERRNLDI